MEPIILDNDFYFRVLGKTFPVIGYLVFTLIIKDPVLALFLSFVILALLQLPRFIDPVYSLMGDKIWYFVSELTPNSLLQLEGRTLTAYSAVRIITMPVLEEYNRLLELQHEFSVFHLETTSGTLYWIYHKLPLGKNWEHLSESCQHYYLIQIQNHVDNFIQALYQKIPGIQFQLLTVSELQHELRC